MPCGVTIVFTHKELGHDFRFLLKIERNIACLRGRHIGGDHVVQRFLGDACDEAAAAAECDGLHSCGGGAWTMLSQRHPQ